ncbi:TPR-like protein [Basidiobolus meristosporus CBS 931.73]|uniref:TPR-like protein n=1 Tax=Basidiobolus meristosporus CBS 931.73 TaxID=1314790 RepID=A0A1Y1Y8A6_9FUNG|nr:TPR-like protein [Basidiobolus meristosporus CBS 931.73]|eukprot:ORX94251.1 TPR-like protein [Basidiobolus meristosporus CBS 931.73]
MARNYATKNSIAQDGQEAQGNIGIEIILKKAGTDPDLHVAGAPALLLDGVNLGLLKDVADPAHRVDGIDPVLPHDDIALDLARKGVDHVPRIEDAEPRGPQVKEKDPRSEREVKGQLARTNKILGEANLRHQEPIVDADMDEEQKMMALMGIGGFTSTKGKKVAGNEVGTADIKKQRQYPAIPRVYPKHLFVSGSSSLRLGRANLFSVQQISSIAPKETPVHSPENATLVAEWRDAFSEYKSSKETSNSLLAAGKLVSLFAQSKPTPFWRDKLSSFHEELRKANFQLDGLRDYGGLFKAFNRFGLLRECEEVLSALKLRELPLNTFIYNNYLELVGKASSTKAFAVYEQMVKQSLLPNVYTYNLLLHSFKIHNNTRHLPRILADMDSASIEKDLYTYSTLISTYVNTSDYARAHTLYDEMLTKGITPDASIFTSMINLYTRGLEASKAAAIYDAMLEQKIVPDVVTFSSLISLYSKIGDLPKMNQVFENMEESGVEPNVVIYSSLIHAAAKHSGLNEAKELYNQMLERNIQPNAFTLSILAGAYIADDQLTSAIGLFNDAVQKGYATDIVLINNLIRACSRENIDLALEVYSQMKRVKVQPNFKTYNLLIGAGHTKLPLATLMDIFQDMLSNQISPNLGIYYYLLGACRAQKKIASADALYLQMTKQGKGIRPNRHTFRMLMELHLHSRNYRQALHYFDELQRWHIEPDSNLYALAIKSHNRLGQHDEVMKLWNNIQVQGFSKESQLSFISSIIDSCGFASDEAFLQSFWDYVKPRYPLNSNHFASFIEAQCRLGHTERAKKVFFEEMIQYGIAVDIKVCQTLITQLKNRGSPQDVVQIINFMMKYHPRTWATLIKLYH